mmetsp:Transcript_71430/g.149264  ORF Transcript_71430/g.149264 Transcript_71430/m.149264 type:complete len:347 (-) Transcript_71430:15-1055(-)
MEVQPQVPTISLAPFFEAQAQLGAEFEDPLAGPAVGEEHPALGALRELVAAVRTACEEVGFFTIIDHGVDKGLLKKQHQECKSFFHRPPQSTIVGMVANSSSRFAWLDYVPSKGAQNEAVEGEFSLGPVDGRNSMPWRPDTKDLSDTWSTYYTAITQVVRVLMRLFALALDLRLTSFDEALEDHRSALRAVFYPEISEEQLDSAGGTIDRSPEHTDWGCVTVLQADDAVAGLEIRHRDGSWLPLPPVDGGLVVNLGDLLPFWTQRRWVGTPHRVVARNDGSRSQRLSIPYFGLVNRSTVLRPLLPEKDLDANDDRPSLPEISAGEFFDHHEDYAKRVKTNSCSQPV